MAISGDYDDLLSDLDWLSLGEWADAVVALNNKS